ncbi:MAG: NfeD family protein [Candidatus Saccharibacteria bacterium]|nr:NfeD family protein [Moraxellaceae bacterium]
MIAWLFWLSVAAIMLIAELMTGILFCLCLCVAALITVAVSGVLSMEVQGIVFAILSAIFLVLWARWRKRQKLSEKPIISEIQHHLMGLELVLSAALEPQAQIRVGDSYWLARSKDGQSIAIGTTVKVVAIDGTMLVVKMV